MEERGFSNNKVIIAGEIVSDFTFSHEVLGEKFYVASLSSERTSATADVIPITVSDRLVDVKADWKGQYVQIEGCFRSYNTHTDGRNHLILSVFVQEIEPLDGKCDENHIYLEGYICKPTEYRKTPLGREISDIMVAVNRSYGKTDYIPCIVWGRNARFAGNLEVGTKIAVTGRIQSREYSKRIGEDEFETRIAYEVSASRVDLMEETEDDEHEKED